MPICRNSDSQFSNVASRKAPVPRYCRRLTAGSPWASLVLAVSWLAPLRIMPPKNTTNSADVGQQQSVLLDPLAHGSSRACGAPLL